MTPTDEPETAPRRSQSRNRQTLGMAAAVFLGVIVVVAVLLVTLSAGDSSDKPEVATEDTTPTTTPLPPELQEPIIVPEGDYTELCATLLEQAAGVSEEPTAQEVRALYETMDFAPLIAVAPEGLVPSLEQLRDQRDEVLIVLEQVDDMTELAAADLPEGYVRALLTVTTSASQKCVTG